MTNQTEQPHLRFLCFGTGAIGTYIGGSLALSGQQVVFIDRLAVVEELRRNGLRILLKDQEKVVEQPDLVASIDEALTQGPFDVAILAVKSYDTRELAESLRQYKNSVPPVLSFQNGVENEAVLAEVLGPEKVISGTVTTAIGRRGTGSIVVEKLRGVGVAEGHPLSYALVSALDYAGLRAKLYPDALTMKWSKMLTNLLTNASSAILDLPPGEIFANPGLYRIEVEQIKEALQVMKAQGLKVFDLPGTPVRLLVWIMSHLPLALSRPLLAQSVGKGRGDKMPSFHIDLHQGRGKSEVDYLNGAVVRHGSLLGIKTSTNQFLTDTLLALTRGDLPLNRFAHQPDVFIQSWKESTTKEK